MTNMSQINFAGLLLGNHLASLETEEAWENYQSKISEVRSIINKFMAKLKKMNSVRLARKLEKMTGEVVFNPWQERQEVIGKLYDLAVINGEIPSFPTSPRLEANELRMCLGLPAFEEIRRSNGVLSREDVMYIVKLRNLGLTYREISEITGVSDNMCCAITTGISYRHFTGLTKASK